MHFVGGRYEEEVTFRVTTPDWKVPTYLIRYFPGVGMQEVITFHVSTPGKYSEVDTRKVPTYLLIASSPGK